MRLLASSAAALLLAIPAPAQKAGPFGPSPAGRALERIAEDDARPETLAPAILEAASRRWTSPLFPRLLDVLEEWVRDDPARLPVVLEAFGRATERLDREEAVRALLGAADELRARLARPAGPPAAREGWHRPRPDELPVPWEAPGLSREELRARRVGFVDSLLPKESRTSYVRAGFEAFLAPSCGAFLGGGATEACEGVGLEPLRWAALAAALAGLSGDGTEPGLVDAYLGVPAGLTTRVLDEVSYGRPGVRCDECVLLRSWLARRPTRWQVRAALEPPLLP